MILINVTLITKPYWAALAYATSTAAPHDLTSEARVRRWKTPFTCQ